MNRKGKVGGRDIKSASSSSASAALARSGVASGGFIGFGAFAASASAPAGHDYGANESGGGGGGGGAGSKGGGAASHLYAGADGELGLALRKLGKKDTITKIKGLAELQAIASDEARTAEVLEEALPNFIYCFNRLIVDNDRRVREGACACLGPFASTMKTRPAFAEQLGDVIGAWWCARFDPRGEIAALARAAFDATFPRLKKVLRVHARRLFRSLRRNLEHTADSLGALLELDKVDAANCLDRVHSGSLKGMCDLIKEMPPAARDELFPVPAGVVPAADEEGGGEGDGGDGGDGETKQGNGKDGKGSKGGKGGKGVGAGGKRPVGIENIIGSRAWKLASSPRVPVRRACYALIMETVSSLEPR